MTIEASFSWRLLHRFFIDQNGDAFDIWIMDSLPANAGKLTFKMALRVIHQNLLNLKILNPDQTLNLFIGVDEYQAINKVSGVKVGEQELLQDFLDVLGSTIAEPLPGVRIYPMLAGINVSSVSIVNTSRTETCRLPLYLLDSHEVENAIGSITNGDRLLR